MIIFAEVSRMARSTLQILEMLECSLARGISVHIAKQAMVFDESLPSRIAATVMGLAAEIERELISLRTTEALAKKKAEGEAVRGRPKGRLSQTLKLDAKEAEIRDYLAKGISKLSIAKLVECSPTTLYDWLERRQLRVKKTLGKPEAQKAERKGMAKRRIPSEALIELNQRLGHWPSRSAERRELVRETAQLYGVSEYTIYRALRERTALGSTKRADSGQPRVMPRVTLERYCEVIAALKIRTTNKKSRHLSTVSAIRLLEEEGIHTPDGFIRAPKDLLRKTTVNRYLQQWGYDRERLSRQPPVVHFQAEHSNDCWHFDLSTSDLKHVKTPAWIEPGRG